MISNDNTGGEHQDRTIRLVGSAVAEVDPIHLVNVLANFAQSGAMLAEIEVPRSQAIRLARALNDLLNPREIYVEVFYS